jgi:hypothetical protein
VTTPHQNANASPAARASAIKLELEALASLGSANQRERYLANVLPESELLALVRTELFKPFDGFTRLHKLTASDLIPLGCACHGKPGWKVEYETAEAAELGHEQWETLAAIRRAAEPLVDHHWIVRSSWEVESGPRVLVETLAHWATCNLCQTELDRPSAKVSIRWAGRVLTREYQL